MQFLPQTIAGSLLLVVLAACFDLSSAFAEGGRDAPTLRAFSLGAAERSISRQHSTTLDIASVGYVTQVWGVLLSDSDDIIMFGDVSPDYPIMELDDVVVALRSRRKVDQGDNPGVSIEPLQPGRYSKFQDPKFFGGVDSTHFGLVCLQADLLLKHLSEGFVRSGVPGLPSEWDLSLDNAKAGRDADPWERLGGRSWFFPLKVNMTRSPNCVAVTSIVMVVETDLDQELAIPQRYVGMDSDLLGKMLEKEPTATGLNFARLLTQNYDRVATTHPVLLQLENLICLSGLFAELLRGSTAASPSRYWEEQYVVRKVPIPCIPTLSRAVSGVAYSMGVSGGIRASYVGDDAWTDAVVSLDPDYLREAILGSRPSPDAVSWNVPLGHGPPDTWSPTVRAEVTRPLDPTVTFSLPAAVSYDQSSPDLAPVPTPGWHPATEGSFLLAFQGRFGFSSGGYNAFSIDGRFNASGADVALNMPVSLSAALWNRLSLEVSAPLSFKMEFKDKPDTHLPGITTNIIPYVFGIESPVIEARGVLLSGIHRGRWRLPAIMLDNAAVVPTYDKIMDGYFAGEAAADSSFAVGFGTDDWIFAHRINVVIPMSSTVRLGGWGEYGTKWNGSATGDSRSLGCELKTLLMRSSGMSLGFRFDRQSVFDREWLSQGTQFLISLGIPTRSGTNIYNVGWLTAGSRPGTSGAFILSLDLSGTLLWDERLWF